MKDLVQFKFMIENVEIYCLICSKVLFSILFAFLDTFVVLSLFDIKISRKEKIKIIIKDSIIKSILMIMLPVLYFRIVDMIVTIILLKRSLKKITTEKCILGNTINAITTICPEIMISKMFEILYDVRYIYGMCNFNYFTSIMLVVTVVRLLCLDLIKFKKAIFNIKDDLSPQNKSRIIAISVICSLSLFLNLIEMANIRTHFSYVVFLLQFMFLTFLSLENIDQMTILENEQMEKSNLEFHNKTLSLKYDNIRGFKHDFYNFVQALEGYAKTNNIDGIKVLSKGILKECISTNKLESLNPQIINDPAIYNLVTNKYYLAQQKGINMNVEVMLDLTNLDITSYELCKILAILLDNALEAAEECEGEKIVNVKFLKDIKVDRKLIIVENSYKDYGIDIDKIFEKDFSTKKKEEEDTHGMGLWNVRKILNRNDNLNLYTTKGELFSQQLEVYTLKVKEKV